MARLAPLSCWTIPARKLAKFHPAVLLAALLAVPAFAASPPPVHTTTQIPGPLVSFFRMAAVSPQTAPGDVLPYLARNIFEHGYSDGRPTEELNLLRHYLQQAQELKALAGSRQVIRVAACRDARPLLHIIGYRLKGPCGPQLVLQTADRNRAFLAVDSGFPITRLQQALQQQTPFVLPYPSSPLPLLFSARDWTRLVKHHRPGSPVLALLSSPQLARLYSGLAGMDPETAAALRRSPGLPRLLRDAGTVDFFGGNIVIRSGRVLVPGGAAADPAWRRLVGDRPSSPGNFVRRLLSRDHGWLAVYFDDLARLDPAQAAYFTTPVRLLRLYAAVHGTMHVNDGNREAAGHALRPDTNLFLLLNGQLWQGGQPWVPGGVQVWTTILQDRNETSFARKLSNRAKNMRTGDDLLDELAAFSRLALIHSPVPMYLAIESIDRRRPPDRRLDAPTVALLAHNFEHFGDQYLLFTEFPELDNRAITSFLHVALVLDQISDPNLRANALGIFQASTSLWQIFARQGEIPPSRQNASWRTMLDCFNRVATSTQLFHAGRQSLAALASAAGAPTLTQSDLIALLAGPPPVNPQAGAVRQWLAGRISSEMAAQRLVSLDTLLALDDGIERLAQDRQEHRNEVGAPPPELLQQAQVLGYFELPRPIFHGGVRGEVSGTPAAHAILQIHTDLTPDIAGHASAKTLDADVGRLAPFLRDTLVGLNYAYYQPPGGLLLDADPLFVRMHDFARDASAIIPSSWQTPDITADLLGSGGGGGVHLNGSLANLPYVLAMANQDFIVPRSPHSLIWEDAVPSLLTSAVVPRWWAISSREMHAAALYQEAGEELLTAAAHDPGIAVEVLGLLDARLLPDRAAALLALLRRGDASPLKALLTPSEVAFLAATFRRRFPSQGQVWGPAGKALAALVRQDPAETSWGRIAADFGVPHPGLQHTYSLALLPEKPLPAFFTYSSELMAEDWDSGNLYWARLADLKGYSPADLNLLVPALTLRMIENISASNLEDWPALLRAMRLTGAEFLAGAVPGIPAVAATAGNPPLAAASSGMRAVQP